MGAMKPALLIFSFLVVSLTMTGRYIFNNSSPLQSVMGVSHNLACPCECPMVLEDCHMSCGLEWKNVIGGLLQGGVDADGITAYFYKRYGDAALLTPAQRLSGKWYQVTRGGYPVREMVIFGLIVAVWTAMLYLILLTLAERFGPARSGRGK
ncbi:MAG: cytochrome c-type biogenesis protein CcmH [Nitrospinae bacterium]|nr:cytochrome c-type biogenesis protein CcmH [Nitrospinota bacterium]